MGSLQALPMAYGLQALPMTVVAPYRVRMSMYMFMHMFMHMHMHMSMHT